MSLPGALRDQRGFTITELLVATAMMGFVLAAGLAALQAGTQASEIASGRAEAQSNARFALDQMLADMRAAGYDPTSNGFAPVDGGTLAQASVQLVSDRDASGTIDAPAGPCDAAAPAERVRYRQVGVELRRAVMTDAVTAACEAVVIGGLQSLTFSYRDANDQALPAQPASAPSVAAIQVSLTLQPESAATHSKGAGSATMTDRARLRNR